MNGADVLSRTNLVTANLVIMMSANGRDNWHPIKSEDVPDWVKQPDNLARMVAGEACMNASEGENGSSWYVALHVSDLQCLGGIQ